MSDEPHDCGQPGCPFKGWRGRLPSMSTQTYVAAVMLGATGSHPVPVATGYTGGPARTFDDVEPKAPVAFEVGGWCYAPRVTLCVSDVGHNTQLPCHLAVRFDGREGMLPLSSECGHGFPLMARPEPPPLDAMSQALSDQRAHVLALIDQAHQKFWSQEGGRLKTRDNQVIGRLFMALVAQVQSLHPDTFAPKE